MISCKISIQCRPINKGINFLDLGIKRMIEYSGKMFGDTRESASEVCKKVKVVYI